ncbi:DUF2069 domain-containing protein [Neisseria sp. Ec49-e6-T10]|uniref:DUF2069 domain-containing protein n=1 Tax=Neisseria sp. Ec49-e6-T10 TaxID=3140744 RepID=UPI003EB722DC
MNIPTKNLYKNICSITLIALILLCLLWELWIAPIRVGGSFLVFKTLPLLLPLSGILKGRKYTYQYSSMFILLYVAEGSVRIFDKNTNSQICAAIELGLSILFFVSTIIYIRKNKD